ncbi:MAG TPA: hypothetical protein VJM08_18670 [Anaerolineales bacterium]|nr:hypothetical protein [Anaerolineales bacterium]
MATNDETSQYEKWDMEVAKRIACAVTSYQAGIPFEELWGRYVNQNEPVGTFWLAIAKWIREELPKKSK